VHVVRPEDEPHSLTFVCSEAPRHSYAPRLPAFSGKHSLAAQFCCQETPLRAAKDTGVVADVIGVCVPMGVWLHVQMAGEDPAA
jgi:hypothetical protein